MSGNKLTCSQIAGKSASALSNGHRPEHRVPRLARPFVGQCLDPPRHVGNRLGLRGYQSIGRASSTADMPSEAERVTRAPRGIPGRTDRQNPKADQAKGGATGPSIRRQSTRRARAGSFPGMPHRSPAGERARSFSAIPNSFRQAMSSGKICRCICRNAHLLGLRTPLARS